MVKSVLVKELVHCVLRLVANAKHGTERRRPWAKVGDFAKEFEAVALGLKGVFFGRTVAMYHNLLHLNFNRLTAALRRHE